MLVSFKDYDLPPRFDGQQWVLLRIDESGSPDGPWNTIESQDIDPTIDPAHPEPISFSTDVATYPPGFGWYKVYFIDVEGNAAETEPVFNAGPVEILCTLDDINAHLDGDVLEADANNTQLVQISVNRVVKGYLARIVDPVVMASWASPDTTPDIIREIASMLCASQVYINYAARTSLILENNNFAQRLYDEAMAMLNGIIDGTIPIVGIPPTTESISEMDTNDFFPVDDTNRAFTMGMQL
jgi:hypothetical protein